MIELLIVIAVLLAFAFLVVCCVVQSEFRSVSQCLKHSHELIGELTEGRAVALRKNREFQDEIRDKDKQIMELESELARLAEFRESVKTASATLDGDEE